MPAATPLHILRARLLEEQAAVAAARQALAAATARVAALGTPGPPSRAQLELEAIEAQIEALKRQKAEDEKGAAEARARAERCAERIQQIAALLKDLDPTPRDRQSGGRSDA
jgi:hypothetical protein